MGDGGGVDTPMPTDTGDMDTPTPTDTVGDTVTPPDADLDGTPSMVCGNNMREGTEICDDGNSTNGDGCENDCTYSCTMDSQCGDMNVCNGTETCNTTMHRCGPGTSAMDGTACGMGSICRAGMCVASRCGDTIVTAPEECDDGNMTAGDGCENSCRFTCTMDTMCADTEPCNGAETCNTMTHVCRAGTMLANGTACGTGRVCRMGVCTTANCGNMVVDTGEDCDDGNMVNGDGCETTCRFTCIMNSQCADTNTCNGTETCTLATHRCAAGTALADGAVCDADMMPATRDICRTAMCRLSTCGDGFVDAGRGETCEPPTAGCSPVTCTMAAVARCGDGIIQAPEECDDSNTTRWDGCSNVCRLEQTVRANNIALLGAGQGCDLTGDGTVDNALGRALTGTALGQLNPQLQMGVTAGTTIILAHFLDLDDRLGRNDPAIRIAFFQGVDAMTPFSGLRGENFTITMAQLDAMLNPTSVLAPGMITASASTAGPGTVTLRINLAGMPTSLTLQRARMTGTIVGDVAMNRIDSVTNGRICGVLSAGDLDRIAWPAGLPGSCAMVAGGSLLDLLVSGCSLIIPLVNATQPDIDLGGDGIGQLVTAARIVTTCRDGTARTMLPAGTMCPQDPAFDDGYSMALSFSAIRVNISGVR